MKNYKNKNPLYGQEEWVGVSEPLLRESRNGRKCLACYQPLKNEVNTYYHELCSKKFFGQANVPKLYYKQEDLYKLAEAYLNSFMSVTGVQPKISLSWYRKEESNPVKKLTIVGMYGDFILKPQSQHYPCLPELEDCTMHMATVCGLNTVPHTLFYLADDTLCYLTRRVDRVKKEMRHMEDMCQLSDRLTEDKYKGSHEQIAKLVMKYSASPGLDVTNFYEYVLFSFLTGNADMHLKNFSMLETDERGKYLLAPAYDMLNTALVNPSDKEELALTLNAKKSKLTYNDFLSAYTNAKLSQKTLDNTVENFYYCRYEMKEVLYQSFLSDRMKMEYEKLLDRRMERLVKR
jgi:serine/threonine-protein kinase HipA